MTMKQNLLDEAIGKEGFRELITEALIDLGLDKCQLETATDFALAYLSMFHDLSDSIISPDEMELIMNHVRANIIHLKGVVKLSKKDKFYVSKN